MLIGLALTLVLSSPARLQATCTATTTGTSLTATFPRPTTAGSLVVAAITHTNVARSLRATQLADESGTQLIEFANNADGGGGHDNRIFLGRGNGARSVRVEMNERVDGRAILTLFLAEYEGGTALRAADRRGEDTTIVIGPVTLGELEFMVGSAVDEIGSVLSTGRVDGGVEVVTSCSGDVLVDLLDAGRGTFTSELTAGVDGWNAVWVVFSEQAPDAGPRDAGASATDGGLKEREALRVSSCNAGLGAPFLVLLGAWLLRAAARGAAGTAREARRRPG